MKAFSRLLNLELRRIFRSRRYYYMLLAAVFMAAYSLPMSSSGVGGAAPFSAPSVGALIALNAPVWAGVMVLLCQGIFSEKEQAARRILLSAPVSTPGYFAPKVAGASLAVMAIIAMGLLLFGGYYLYTFGVCPAGELFSALLIIALPGILFTLGIAMLLGRTNKNILYVLFLLVVLLGMFNLSPPLWLDCFGNNLYVDLSYILSLRSYGGQPLIKILPMDFLYGRLGFAFIGIASLCLACAKKIRS